MPFCSQCGEELQSSFKFCPACGEQLSIATRPKPPKFSGSKVAELPPPRMGICIEFQKSTSSSFEFALATAQLFDSFEEHLLGSTTIYRVTVGKGQTASLDDLLEHISGWRKRKVYVDQVAHTWDSVFGYQWCYKRKKSSFRPDIYCFGHDDSYRVNGVGCLHARMGIMDFGEWFTWGQWLDKNGTWKFDKERIQHEIEKNLHEYRFCPAISKTPTQIFLACIPDTVNPKTNKEWEFVEDYTNRVNSLPSPNSDSYMRTYIVGVRPRGDTFARRVFAALNLELLTD
ncbi:MAG: zinc ribbon domain-containing protein [Fimbriimonadaceae bacterium]|nr:MAG: zinc ribbon domain-containing protein [Fimbriimonadaceae bacterium]